MLPSSLSTDLVEKLRRKVIRTLQDAVIRPAAVHALFQNSEKLILGVQNIHDGKVITQSLRDPAKFPIWLLALSGIEKFLPNARIFPGVFSFSLEAFMVLSQQQVQQHIASRLMIFDGMLKMIRISRIGCPY